MYYSVNIDDMKQTCQHQAEDILCEEGLCSTVKEAGDFFNAEICSYAIYLVLTNGEITNDELDFLNYLFSSFWIKITKERLMQMYHNFNTTPSQFMEIIPSTLIAFVKEDNKHFDLNDKYSLKASHALSDRLIGLYTGLAGLVIKADEKQVQDEIMFAKKYIERLEHYQKTNLFYYTKNTDPESSQLSLPLRSGATPTSLSNQFNSTNCMNSVQKILLSEINKKQDYKDKKSVSTSTKSNVQTSTSLMYPYQKVEMLIRDKIQTAGYNISTEFKLGRYLHILIDEENENLFLCNTNREILNQIRFSDVLGMQVIEDGQSTNGVGRAVVGGLLFGGVGAVVGAVTGKQLVTRIDIVIYLNNIDNPSCTFNVFLGKMKKSDYHYSECQEFIRKIDGVIRIILSKNGNI
ncbi:MAG: hypothetical protein K5662_04045 [Lachnospiraceae bacterium]|nr:hypothetical protein [Lachnospiraceae bacterium]